MNLRIRHLRWLFWGIVFAILCVATIAGPVTIGLEQEWSGNNYRFTGGTHPWALSFSALLFLLYCGLMYAEPALAQKPLAGAVRRFAAFFLDFLLGGLMIFPVSGLIVTLWEWKRTGVFEWLIERTEPARGDAFLFGFSFICSIAALVVYFTVPLLRQRPSPGACMLGYQVVSDEGTALTPVHAIVRTLFAFLAMGAWFITLFVFRNRKKGKLWFDYVFHTRAVTLQ
ncbi:MAG TPA: RDD family protein [Candidatus Angelobacter sp.]|nr:RDD family protein [Candidatus Angelobacter sp.]